MRTNSRILHTDRQQRPAVGTPDRTPSVASRLRPQLRAHRIGHSSILAVALTAQLCSAGCTQWVPINPDLTSAKVRKIDHVRLVGKEDEILTDAALAGPVLTATKKAEVTLDLSRIPPESVYLLPNDIAAIATGGTHKIDQMRMGEALVRKGMITWPVLTGTILSREKIDLRLTPAEEKRVNPGRTAAFVTAIAVGGVASVTGILIGLGCALASALHSSC